MQCFRNIYAMHWIDITYDKHSCAMQCNAMQCIAIKLLMISIVVQCIGIALLMISIVVLCIGIALLMIRMQCNTLFILSHYTTILIISNLLLIMHS